MITSLFSYSLLSAIFLTVIYGVYSVAMRGQRCHTLNRTLLIAVMVLSLLLPLLPAIPLPTTSGAAGATDLIELGTLTATATTATTAPQPRPAAMPVLAWIYAGGALLLAGAIMAGLTRIWFIMSHSEIVWTTDGTKVVIADNPGIAPFSFMGTIVMSRRDFETDGGMIMCHESAHISQRHWIDLLLARAICLLQWYNPAAWIMAREVSAVHEYLADNRVISSGADPRSYQMLLVARATGMRLSPLANSLNNSKLKNRITMMNNSTSSPLRRLRALALVPAIGVALLVANIPAIASTLHTTDTSGGAGNLDELTVVGYANQDLTVTKSDSGKDVAEPDRKVFDLVEQMPRFPGGEAALMRYLAEQIRYPKQAHDNGTQGRVVVQFVVGKDGAVSDTKVLRSVDPELDAEAMRVVSTLPAFQPGMNGGKAVAVWYTLPIAFKLTGSAKKPTEPAIFVDGELYKGSLDKLDKNLIEAIDVMKDDPAYPFGRINITMKKK